MNEPLNIYCKNTGEYMPVQGGETLLEIYERIKGKINITPICAHVNNKTEDLHFPVYKPNMVEFLDLSSPSGSRVYTRSLCMVLYKAVTEVCPTMRLRMRHSISNGYYAQIVDNNDNEIIPDDELVGQIKQHMRNLVDQDIPFVRRHNDPTKVILRSENPDYDDMEIDRDKIRELMFVQNIIHIDTRM